MAWMVILAMNAERGGRDKGLGRDRRHSLLTERITGSRCLKNPIHHLRCCRAWPSQRDHSSMQSTCLAGRKTQVHSPWQGLRKSKQAVLFITTPGELHLQNSNAAALKIIMVQCYARTWGTWIQILPQTLTLLCDLVRAEREGCRDSGNDVTLSERCDFRSKPGCDVTTQAWCSWTPQNPLPHGLTVPIKWHQGQKADSGKLASLP